MERIGINSAILEETDDELIFCRESEPDSGVAAIGIFEPFMIAEVDPGVLWLAD